jgi:hypothetical protein
MSLDGRRLADAGPCPLKTGTFKWYTSELYRLRSGRPLEHLTDLWHATPLKTSPLVQFRDKDRAGGPRGPPVDSERACASREPPSR